MEELGGVVGYGGGEEDKEEGRGREKGRGVKG